MAENEFGRSSFSSLKILKTEGSSTQIPGGHQWTFVSLDKCPSMNISDLGSIRYAGFKELELKVSYPIYYFNKTIFGNFQPCTKLS